MKPLYEWQTFSEVLGSAAGALTGLQFVVMALISEMPLRQGENETGEAFATPTVVHFTAVLMLAASLAMPWTSLGSARMAWMLGGLAGLTYTLFVLRRMQRQAAYKPVFEDWLFHALLPLGAYTGLIAFAVVTRSHEHDGVFGIAGMSLLLLVIGIHNAWDNVTYLVTMKRERLHGRAGTEGHRP